MADPNTDGIAVVTKLIDLSEQPFGNLTALAYGWPIGKALFTPSRRYSRATNV